MVQKSNVYFVIGVNGVGKTTLVNSLREKLASDNYHVHDFDERGVPDNVDDTWRVSETRYWLTLGKENIEKGITTIVCGFSKPQEVNDAFQEAGIQTNVCLLDINEETITKRIVGRYTTDASIQELKRTTGKTVEKFVMDNCYISSMFREKSRELDFHTLKTSELTPDEVAAKVIDWITSEQE